MAAGAAAVRRSGFHLFARRYENRFYRRPAKNSDFSRSLSNSLYPFHHQNGTGRAAWHQSGNHRGRDISALPKSQAAAGADDRLAVSFVPTAAKAAPPAAGPLFAWPAVRLKDKAGQEYAVNKEKANIRKNLTFAA